MPAGTSPRCGLCFYTFLILLFVRPPLDRQLIVARARPIKVKAKVDESSFGHLGSICGWDLILHLRKRTATHNGGVLRVGVEALGQIEIGGQGQTLRFECDGVLSGGLRRLYLPPTNKGIQETPECQWAGPWQEREGRKESHGYCYKSCSSSL